MNKLSFFKLPFIFTCVFFIANFIGSRYLAIVTQSIFIEAIYIYFVYDVFFLLFPFTLFFLTVVFCCQKYRLHSSYKNGRQILVLGIIAALLYWGFNYAFHYVFVSFFREMLPNSPSDYETLIIRNVLDIVRYLLFVFILQFLFYLISGRQANQRPAYELTGFKGRHIYGHVFSFLIFLLIIKVTQEVLFIVHSYLQLFTLTISAIFSIIMMFFLYYFIIFLCVCNRFKQIDNSIKCGKLLITAFITYSLFFLSIAIVIYLFLYLVNLGGISYEEIYAYINTPYIILMLIMLSFILLIILTIISRFAINIMYNKKSERERTPTALVQ